MKIHTLPEVMNMTPAELEAYNKKLMRRAAIQLGVQVGVVTVGVVGYKLLKRRFGTKENEID